MGCISSKFLATTDIEQNISTHHVVSLTSTTYGLLNLDPNGNKQQQQEEQQEAAAKDEEKKEAQIAKANKVFPTSTLFTPQSKKRVLKEEPPEIINTWELMKGLSPAMKPANFQRPGSSNSPKNQKRRLLGKENHSPRDNQNRVLRPFSSLANRPPSKLVVDHVKSQKLVEKDPGSLGSRRSLSPLFDPELVASFERELNKEEEQIKKIVSTMPVSQKEHDSCLLLEAFEEKCPPNGENALIFYSTTLRGIRKTFEDCNAVRTTIEAYDVKIMERDISMDSGFREELRVLMGKQEVRPPLLFVKGRLIGGVGEVMKLENEGKLELLLDGMPKKESSGCGVCGGMRFVMCRECNGSCKVLDDDEKKMVKCGYCNENGLIHCPICCCSISKGGNPLAVV